MSKTVVLLNIFYGNCDTFRIFWWMLMRWIGIWYFLYFVFVSQAAGQQIVPQVSAAPKPGVIHRPQVQLIQDNVVTLSNVQAPANLSPQSHTTSVSQNTPGVSPAIVKQKTLQPMNSRGKPVCVCVFGIRLWKVSNVLAVLVFLG